MAETAGSSGQGGGAYICFEADCSDSDTEVDSPVQCSDSSDEDLVDNANIVPGNHLELFQTQEKEAGERQISLLKRKFCLSPGTSEVEELSPGLAGIRISPPKRNPVVRRRLFDAGGRDAVRTPRDHEVNSSPEPRSQVQSGSSSRSWEGHLESINEPASDGNMAAVMHKLFKTLYIAGFGEITRVFQSDKTNNNQWVIAAHGASEVLYAASFEILSKHCSYLQASRKVHETGSMSLFLAVFNVGKSRETVRKLISGVLNTPCSRLLLQPPKIRGLCPALFWFKLGLSPATQTHGTTPDWIKQQTNVAYNTGEASKFDFGTMVQWAYDHRLTEECKIAYQYAKCAGTDLNAKAFLASTNQARLVKDCCTMVKHYLRAEEQSLTISAFIKRRCDNATGKGSWLSIMNLLKFQGIEPINFVNALKPWLKGTPKHNCIAIVGPPNSGKSLLCNTLMSFLGGKVLTFANHSSHFWLAPLTDCRVALIDDATHACWRYFDTYLRNVLDGYPVCIDRKHKSAVQLKAPPLLLTSNIDVHADEKYFYLQSRVKTFYFKEPCPASDTGEPLFFITDADWKNFFERLWERLDLSDQEDEVDEDECSQRSFTCSARNTDAMH
ncbi:replication protein [Alces alces papillomavirus 1]|uniref:Replication protein E1 n=1 Tax=European elk papillomavirus TaxID=2885846 RepID=VE1_PAPVE|nr:replication protein [Alces alces papillomavirus 1]P11328.1 RecName: Full=Replication protein E1; AltName: Full=ATP-dependent helicase E1 [Alces alces papillomavirus 1]AAA66852.1 replication protein [Alces alces papillomavirus 1]